MQITASAVSLNVEDERTSADFLTGHFGFHEEMAADGFVSLTRPDVGMKVVFLRRGLPTLPEGQRETGAAGLILAFVVRTSKANWPACRAKESPSACRCARSLGENGHFRSPTPTA